MRISHIIVVIAVLLTIIPAAAVIAAESAQYSHRIEVHNGIALVDMGDHVEFLDTVNENYQTVPSYKITGYQAPKNNNTVPAMLPGTSAPHGDHTCDFGTYQVTTDQPCEDLQ